MKFSAQTKEASKNFHKIRSFFPAASLKAPPRGSFRKPGISNQTGINSLNINVKLFISVLFEFSALFSAARLPHPRLPFRRRRRVSRAQTVYRLFAPCFLNFLALFEKIRAQKLKISLKNDIFKAAKKEKGGCRAERPHFFSCRKAEGEANRPFNKAERPKMQRAVPPWPRASPAPGGSRSSGARFRKQKGGLCIRRRLIFGKSPPQEGSFDGFLTKALSTWPQAWLARPQAWLARPSALLSPPAKALFSPLSKNTLPRKGRQKERKQQ